MYFPDTHTRERIIMIGFFFPPIRLEYNQEKYRYNNMTMSMRVVHALHIMIL